MEISKIEVDGVIYDVEYEIDVDVTGEEIISVFLPDGTVRQTVLQGLSVKHAITTHLKYYLSLKKK